MELKLEHVLFFLVFIFIVQFVMRNCHCDFNRLIEGTEDKKVIDLSNLGLGYGTSKVYYYVQDQDKWYLYNGGYDNLNFGVNPPIIIEGGGEISEVVETDNIFNTLKALKDADVYKIAYESYTSSCRGFLNSDKCGKGRYYIYLDKKPTYSYEINWKNFHWGDGNERYCNDSNAIHTLNGDIYKLTSFKREWSTNCK